LERERENDNEREEKEKEKAKNTGVPGTQRERKTVIPWSIAGRK